ncbi:non-ribosomal peptide synthetase [Pseudoalteromonas luteoviolacea]|uniref:non-ribosomal peptide synthetase n=1 Tax=Pseudoalteromonas luteoviolacea TaxID=43657 RepID=UPI00114F7E56|nr:non-ribosomal peptide synthetase [Pseudoalteromonas luteoviolacea]TQF71316.1 amino acid adenylation domain-containing protein [Pseudoalteromonas luteoviolacea]
MISNLIKKAVDAGVFLFVEDQQLKFQLSVDKFPEDLKAEILNRKLELIAFLSQQSKSVKKESYPKIEKREHCDSSLPLSFSQQRMWFIDELQEGNSSNYNMSVAFDVHGDFELSIAERALKEIIIRHEILRTNYQTSEEGPIQVVGRGDGFSLAIEDLVQLSGKEKSEKIAKLLDEDALRPFDLRNDLMLRASWLQLEDRHGILMFNMHHIASDGWSSRIIINEFSQLYRAYLNDNSTPLLPVNFQYADYTLWQRQYFQGNVLKEQTDYWAEQLSSVPVLHSLPLDYDRPAQPQRVADKVVSSLTSSQAVQINQLAIAYEATPFMLLHAVFSLLLSRHSGESKIVIGTPIVNRPQSELENIVGFFANTIALCSDTSQSESFSGYLKHIKAINLEAQENQDLPFGQVVDMLNVPRNLQYNPLVQIMFSMDTNGNAEFALDDVTFKPLESNKVNAIFDLNLVVEEHEEGIDLFWNFDVALFNRDTVEKLSRHFTNLLTSILADPTAKLADLSMLSACEASYLVNELNEVDCDYNNDKLLHKYFEEQVELKPESIAVVYQNQSLSYKSLNEKANQLAYFLREKGVSHETLVGVYLERSVDIPLAVLAILKAGGAYVPLDPNYPIARLQYMIADSGLKYLITCSALGDSLSLGSEIDVVTLNDSATESDIERLQVTNLEPLREQDLKSLAYVIYTSGSTGQPKGVLQVHENVARLFLTTQQNFQFNEKDVWTLFHSIAFDFSVWELWGALVYGAKLVIPSYNCTRDPEAFLALCQQHEVSILNQTPSAFNSFIKAALQCDAQLPSLRKVVFGGEALQVESLMPWWERYGDSKPQLINMYGITETTVHVTYKELKKDDQSRSLIGHSLPDQRIYLLNPDQSLAPLGSAGEIYVGGAGLARGYLNQEQLTKERFIESPFIESERLYRTGDIAKYNKDGELEFLGRIDDQVKVRGFRIELGEIEQQLITCENVSTCLTMLQTDDNGQKVLVAYVEPQDDKTEEQKLAIQLRKVLQQSLPDYMIPTHFVVINEWPTTPSGKINRKALPKPSMSISLEGYTPPNTAIETELCNIWQEVLSLEKVGVNDNFFNIGGDSIRALSVIAKSRTVGLSFSVSDLFIAPTIKKLASKVEKCVAERNTMDHIPAFSLINESEKAMFTDENIEDVYPLSTLQQGMIFHNLKEQEAGTYHDVMGFHMKLQWNESHFRKALESLVKEHSSFRTVFQIHHTRPLQVVFKSLPLILNVYDLTHLVAKEQLNEIKSWSQAERTASFDFTQPLWSMTVHVLTENEINFTLVCHHALWDGWSVSTLGAELFSRYHQLLAGNSLPQSDVPLPFANFIAAEQKALNSKKANEFWKTKLHNVKLPWWNTTHRGKVETLEFKLGHQRSSAITLLAKQLGVQEKSVFLCAHMILMRILGGENDVTSSVVVHGRPEALNSDKTLGLFLNSLPFRMVMNLGHGVNCWQNLITSVEQELLEILEHRCFPLVEIQRESGCDFSASLFNFTDFHVLDKVTSDFDVVDSETFDQTNYLLDIDYAKDPRTGLFNLSIKLDTLAFGCDIRSSVIRYLGNIFDYMLNETDKEISLYTLMGEQETAKLLSTFNSPTTDYQGAKTIHQRFEAQVAATPDAVAVVHHQRVFSYTTLNIKANRLAHYLRQLGIKANDLVAIYAKRSPEFLIGILAIMKAGGAYVPIDPTNPQKRIDYMLENANAKCILTESALVSSLTTARECFCLDTIFDDLESPLKPELEKSLATFPCTNPEAINNGNDIAYMIYTSGSTGKPKGALVHHAGALNHIDAEFDVLGFMHQDRHSVSGHNLQASNFLQSAASSSDVSVWQFLAPVISGGKTVILDDMMDMPSLISLIQQHDVHLIQTAPVVLQLLLEYVSTLPLEGRTLPSLRWLMTIAEATPVGLVNTWLDLYPNIPIMNGFGPSEASDDIAYHIIDSPLPSSVHSVPIGKPLPNLTLYVLSQDLELQPIGVPGEICVSGVGVGPGYYQNSEKTGEAFVDNPYVGQFSVHGEYIYRTGDLGYWLPDGNLVLLGRIDNQVKVRGFRVELGEVEAALSSLEGVGDVAVIVSKDRHGENMLAAYLVSQLNTRLDYSAIREALIQKLPEYMIPASVMWLDKMPLNAADKIDRQALPAPDLSSQQREYVAPRTKTEARLCQIWQEVLGLEQVGINDNFFAIGGHSLLATQLITKTNREMSVDITLKQLFEFDSLASMATSITDSQIIANIQFNQNDEILENEVEMTI